MLPLLLDVAGWRIYSYPLLVGFAWGIAFRLAEGRLPASIGSRQFSFWVLGLLLSSWVGAKLLFLATPSAYDARELATASSFWLGGGFVFLGGLLGGFFYTLIVGGVLPRFRPTTMQFTLVPLLWGHAIGRLGCFLAGCCFGTQTDLPWAVHLHGFDRHPVQLYEAAGLAGLALVLKNRKNLLAEYLVGYGALRLLVEFFRGDEIRGAILGLSTSQWIALPMILVGAIIFLRKSRALD